MQLLTHQTSTHTHTHTHTCIHTQTHNTRTHDITTQSQTTLACFNTRTIPASIKSSPSNKTSVVDVSSPTRTVPELFAEDTTCVFNAGAFAKMAPMIGHATRGEKKNLWWMSVADISQTPPRNASTFSGVNVDQLVKACGSEICVAASEANHQLHWMRHWEYGCKKTVKSPSFATERASRS